MTFVYIRSHYSFGLKAGGSVGHTAGVINSLQKLSSVRVFSNDNLVGVKNPIELVSPVKVPFFPNSINELLYSLKLIYFLKDKISKNETIYQRYSGFSFAGAFLSKFLKVPFVLEFNSSAVWTLKNWKNKCGLLKSIIRFFYNLFFLIPLVKLNERYNLKRAYKIVVVSEVLKEQLVEMGVQEERIIVNPNGVDLGKFNLQIVPVEKRDETIVGFIGTFGQWHGVEVLSDAIVEYLRKYADTNVHFLLIGAGELHQKCRQAISEAGFSEYVTFTGLVPQEMAPKYLAACDVLLSPHTQNSDGTRFFGSPTKLFEYMAMGKAIIASDLEQIGSILQHKQNAFLVRPGDAKELAEAIHTVVLDKELCGFIGQKAYADVIDNYTWDEHVKRIIEKVNANI